MADCEHFHSVSSWCYPVQHHISGPAVGYDQFTQPSTDGTADVWMALEYFDGVDDELRRLDRGKRVDGSQLIEQPIEIDQRTRTVGNRGQRDRPAGAG